MKRRAIGQSNTAKRIRTNANEEDVEYIEDTFDVERRIDITKDVCDLCKQGHQFGLLLKRSLDSEKEELDVSLTKDTDIDGVWVSRYAFSAFKKSVFVHFYCAFTCPRAWFTVDRIWKGVRKEVQRGRSLPCSECKRNGATIGCLVKSCGIKLHLPCAMKNGFKISRYTSNNFVCKKHRQEQEQDLEKRHDTAAIATSLSADFTRGKEKIPIKCNNSVDQLDPGEGFTYVTENIDSDDVALNSRSVDDLPCCSCTGLCDDPATCSCLAEGKNYSLQGALLSSTKHQKIVECNLRCDCSFRRCTNRVVSNGLAKRVELFRISNDRRYQWGVRLQESVPTNTFICEINGQIQKAPTANASPYQFMLPPFGTSDLYCLDCSSYGNISRFIRAASPSKGPKMLMQRFIYTSSKDNAIPRIGVFSIGPIGKGQELFL